MELWRDLGSGTDLRATSDPWLSELRIPEWFK
jgi:hypothetical protein